MMPLNETPISIEELLTEREWLTRLARRLVADSGAADDLVQETWLTAITRPPSHRRGLRGWLATVLRNRARDEWDRGQREDRRRSRSNPAAPPDDPADIVARAELEQRVAQFTLALPEPYRTTLVMRYHRGLTPAEIARRLGDPPGTIRSRLKRGHDLLRERLDRESDGERRSWVLALLPLARRSIPAGGTAMLTLPLKIALVAIALTVGLTGAAALVASPSETEPPPLSVSDGASPVPAPPPAPAPEPPDEPVAPGAPAEEHPLDQVVTVDFDNRKLRDVLQFVTDSTGIPFGFDRGLDPDREHRVVTLNAEDITLRSMLDLVCILSGLTWKLTPDGAIRIAARPKTPKPKTTPSDRPWFGGANGLFDSPEPTENRAPPEISLPAADMAETLPVELVENAIRIEVGADGSRFCSGADITDDYALWLLLLSRPDAPVLIFADEAAPVGRVQRIRSLAGNARSYIVTRGGTGLVLPGGPKPTGDLTVMARVQPRNSANGTRDPLDVYRTCWRIHQANTGKVIVLHSVFDCRASVSHLTVLLNEAVRFGWPISLGLPVGVGRSEANYFLLFPTQGTPLAKGEVPELRPSVALGRYPADITPAEGTTNFRYSRWFMTGSRKGHRNLRAEGGGASTWNAENLGLAWLSRQQRPDGSFGDGEADTAHTVLAFLAVGVGARKEVRQYEDLVHAGLAWLEEHDASSGPATMAFAEAYALTDDPRWLESAAAAAKKTRSGVALRIARFCGVPVQVPDAEVIGDGPTACLTKILDGRRPWQDEELERAMRIFTEPVENDPAALNGADSQFLHDATLAVFQAGGRSWGQWLRAMKPALLNTQIKTGPGAGSWPRREGASQIRDTALNVATLTVFYRYARLFRR